MLGVVVGGSESSVTISTVPSNGPFYIGQTVQFTCEIDSTMATNVSYHWTFAYYYYRIFRVSSQSFNHTFTPIIMRHSLYTCTVKTSSGIILEKARKVIEVYGKTLKLVIYNKYIFFLLLLGILRYASPQLQVLVTNSNVTMNISIFNNYRDFFLDMNLTWYHNGSRIADNDRRRISNNGTSLTILNAADSDVGQYVVKIDSMVFTANNSMECDGNFLPLLEDMAIHAPATFILQQNSFSIYNPDSIIENYFISPYSGEAQKTITISKTVVVENSAVFRSFWGSGYEIRNGNYFYTNSRALTFNRENITLTRTISYNNSADVIGDYEILIIIGYYSLRAQCPGYYSYIRSYPFYDISFYHYWTIATKCKLKHLSL